MRLIGRYLSTDYFGDEGCGMDVEIGKKSAEGESSV